MDLFKGIKRIINRDNYVASEDVQIEIKSELMEDPEVCSDAELLEKEESASNEMSIQSSENNTTQADNSNTEETGNYLKKEERILTDEIESSSSKKNNEHLVKTINKENEEGIEEKTQFTATSIECSSKEAFHQEEDTTIDVSDGRKESLEIQPMNQEKPNNNSGNESRISIRGGKAEAECKSESNKKLFKDNDETANTGGSSYFEPSKEFESDCIGSKSEMSYFGFSMVGETHINNNTKCQDRCLAKISGLESDYVISAIADGLGSCEFSDIGARIAVSTAVAFIDDHISIQKDNPDGIVMDAVKGAMNAAYEEVERFANARGQSVYLYCSTLTVVVYTKTVAYIGHAGDDGVVLINKSGKYGLVTARHKGEEASSVFPLQSKETWEFLRVKDTVCVIMATDGVLDACVRGSRENNQVFFPLIEPVTTINGNRESLERIASIYQSFMRSDEFRKVVKDDITFLAVVNTEEIPDVHFLEFDIEKWTDHNKRRNIDIYKALFPDQELTDDIVDSWGDTDKNLLDCLRLVIHENTDTN